MSTTCLRALIRAVRGTRGLPRAWIVAVALLIGVSPGAVAQDAVITGVVVSARTQQPLPGVQVVVQETRDGTHTDAQGRFRIANVPGAEATLRVSRIGFRTVTQTAAVGGSPVQIEMAESAIDLDAIVVTGTPGGTARRAIGNTVSSIQASDLQSIAPASDMAGLLRGRASSVSVLPTGGMVGSGARVRIRGVASLSLDSEPLIYIDGVRVDNSERMQPRPVGGTRSTVGRFSSMSRLQDLDLSQIESIEVIKGPAAATLYGTEASNGVIQIITRRGAAGAPRFDLSVEQGANWLHDQENRFPTYFAERPDGSIFEYNAVRAAAQRGEPFFRTGHVQRYNLNLSGGSDMVRYSVSGSNVREEGIVAPNRLNRYNFRTNVQAQFSERLDISANLGLQTGRLDSGSESGNTISEAHWPCVTEACHADGIGFATRPTPAEERRMWEEWEDNNQYTGGITVNYQPVDWFRNRLTIGHDQTFVGQHSVAERQTDPRLQQVYGADALGRRDTFIHQVKTTTIDYAGTFSFEPRPNMGAQTSVGFQYTNRFAESSQLGGREFPAPGVTAINATAQITGAANFTEAATVGTYVQQQVSWNDRLFITGAVRADDNSAFGEEFSLVTYPKLSGAWVISEEPFWNLGSVNTLRLRAAYGESGKQPASFAALRIYTPIVAVGGGAGVRPASLGNPDLGPERGKEFEAGFDAGLFEDRLGLEFTAYSKKTADAILNQQVAPSLGFAGSRAVNIGEVVNSGFEFTIRGTPILRENLSWDVSFTAGRNRNEITDMGGLEPLTAAATQQHREGFPVAGFFGPRIISGDVDAQGNVTNVMCDGGTGRDGVEPGGDPVSCIGAPSVYLGSQMPTWEGALTTDVGVGRFRFYAIADFQYDVTVWNHTSASRCQSVRVCAINVFPEMRVANPDLAVQTAINHFGAFAHPDRSHARLRQISASYRVPSHYAAMFGASSADVTMSVRNLPVLWRMRGYDDYLDPDAVTRYSDGIYHYGINFQPTPLPMSFVTAVRLSF